MLILLSPAKKILKFTQPYEGMMTEPLFAEQSKILINIMQLKSVAEIASLMDLSPDLAELNYSRYQNFSFDKQDFLKCYPAVFLFQGDVYQGLQASSWSPKTVEYSQGHLRILSGLYGLLRPLDYIQPYRLEMGVRLKTPSGNNLYDFWRESVTQTLNHQLASQKNSFLINLASTEYSKAIDERSLTAPMITINFYEIRNSKRQMIGIYAKKARGVMAKYLLQNQYDDIERLKKFSELGYQYHEPTSTENHLDFVRVS